MVGLATFERHFEHSLQYHKCRIKEDGYEGGGGGWVIQQLPVDTADQGMCPAGQRDGCSNP